MRFFAVYDGDEFLGHYLAPTAGRAAALAASDNRIDSRRLSVGPSVGEQASELFAAPFRAAADARRWLEGKLDVHAEAVR